MAYCPASNGLLARNCWHALGPGLWGRDGSQVASPVPAHCAKGRELRRVHGAQAFTALALAALSVLSAFAALSAFSAFWKPRGPRLRAWALEGRRPPSCPRNCQRGSCRPEGAVGLEVGPPAGPTSSFQRRLPLAASSATLASFVALAAFARKMLCRRGGCRHLGVAVGGFACALPLRREAADPLVRGGVIRVRLFPFLLGCLGFRRSDRSDGLGTGFAPCVLARQKNRRSPGGRRRRWRTLAPARGSGAKVSLGTYARETFCDSPL